jgi:hypothetical protein
MPARAVAATPRAARPPDVGSAAGAPASLFSSSEFAPTPPGLDTDRLTAAPTEPRLIQPTLADHTGHPTRHTGAGEIVIDPPPIERVESVAPTGGRTAEATAQANSSDAPKTSLRPNTPQRSIAPHVRLVNYTAVRAGPLAPPPRNRLQQRQPGGPMRTLKTSRTGSPRLQSTAYRALEQAEQCGTSID